MATIMLNVESTNVVCQPQTYLLLLNEMIGNNNNTKLTAEAQLNHYIFFSPVESIYIFADIILQNENSIEIVFLSLSKINSILNQQLFNIKSDSFSGKNDTKVKTAILKCLILPNASVIQMAAQTFISFFNIMKLLMIDSISELYKLIEQNGYSQLTKATAINILTEITSPRLLGKKTSAPEVKDFLCSVFMRVGGFFSFSQGQPLDIRYNLTNSIDNFLDVSPEMFQSRETSSSLIQLVIMNIESIGLIKPGESSVSAESFHEKLITILLKIVKNNYEMKDFDQARIFDFVNSKIVGFNFQTNQLFVFYHLILFWISLAKFEYKIIKKNTCIEMINIYKGQFRNDKLLSCAKYNVYRRFCESSMKKIANKLFEIMSAISLNDKDVENPKVIKPHTLAMMCLKSFFKIDPQFIYTMIRNSFHSVLTEYYKNICDQRGNNQNTAFNPPQPFQSKWNLDNSLLLAILIMCQKIDFKRFSDLNEKMNIFFFTPFQSNYFVLKDYVLGTCLKANKIPKITESCLAALTKMFHRYPSFLTPDIFDIIMNWIIENKSTKNPVILFHIMNLIKTICSEDTDDDLNPIVKKYIFNSIPNLVDLFQLGVTSQNSLINGLYQASYSMISNVCTHLIKNSYGWNSTKRLIESEIQILNELVNSLQTEENVAKVTIIIHFFNSIFKFNTQMLYFKPYLEPVTAIYLKILSQNSPLIIEVLHALEVIVQCFDEDSSNLLLNVNAKIDEIMNLNNQIIMANAFYTKAILCQTVLKNKIKSCKLLLNHINDIFGRIISQITYGRISQDLIHLMLKSLALLINSCIYQNQINSEDFDYFFSQFKKFISDPISFQNDDDHLTKANNFYEAMFNFGSSLMKGANSRNIKLYKLFIEDLPHECLNCLQFHFSSNTLIAFFDYIKLFHQPFINKEIKCNPAFSIEITLHGTSSCNLLVNNKAKSVLQLFMSQLKNEKKATTKYPALKPNVKTHKKKK